MIAYDRDGLSLTSVMTERVEVSSEMIGSAVVARPLTATIIGSESDSISSTSVAGA